MANAVFIVSAPRSGGSALSNALIRSGFISGSLSDPKALDFHDETHAEFSHRLTANDLTPEQLDSLKKLSSELTDTVNYNPRLGLRIPLLAEVFPDAKFVLLTRMPVAAISSGLEAWASQQFVTEPELDGWWGEKWSFGLIPGWKQLIGKPLAEIVAKQFLETSSLIIDDLGDLDPARVFSLSYEDLVTGAKLSSVGLSEFLGKEIDLDDLEITNALSRPDLNKWRQRAAHVLPSFEGQEKLLEKINNFRKPLTPELEVQEVKDQGPAPSAGTAFESSFTSSFVELLEKSGSSVAITTYKSGHLILASALDKAIHTSFESFGKPMGLAFQGNKLSIGLNASVASFLNFPELAARFTNTKPAPDNVFVSRKSYSTGDVAIHEMEYDLEGRLVFANTKFSCLSVLSDDFSFVPIWKPKFITGYAPEDRCHLNGLAMVDGRPKYVSALSQTNTAGGWREKKGTSGVLIDVDTDEVILEGLSMPHSPTVYQGKLWYMESGKGTLSFLDLKTKQTTEVSTLPGFTRGLAFIGKYALVGLSQVRESVFKDLPVTNSASERNCGVWVVDIDSGEQVGFLKFEKAIQEIFDVKVLPGMKSPKMIANPDVTAESYVLDAKTLSELETPEPDNSAPETTPSN